MQNTQKMGTNVNNIIKSFNILLSVARETIIGLTIISASLGIYLTIKTNYFDL